MEPQRTRRLLLGGTVLLVAGWLGLLALVAPALLGAVAAATLLPLSLVILPYIVVRVAVRLVDDPRWTTSVGGTTPPDEPSSGRRRTSGTAEAD
jgi:hypothetical protein